jgi:hypothetical protein
VHAVSGNNIDVGNIAGQGIRQTLSNGKIGEYARISSKVKPLFISPFSTGFVTLSNLAGSFPWQVLYQSEFTE